MGPYQLVARETFHNFSLHATPLINLEFNAKISFVMSRDLTVGHFMLAKNYSWVASGVVWWSSGYSHGLLFRDREFKHHVLP